MDNAMPRPWELEGDPNIDHHTLEVISDFDGTINVVCRASLLDARLIVRAVNAHDDLVVACEGLIELANLLAEYVDWSKMTVAKFGPFKAQKRLDVARAALAKARAS